MDRTEEIRNIEEKIDRIMNNELVHLQVSVSELKTDIEWLKKFFFIIATSSIGGLVGAIINLIK